MLPLLWPRIACRVSSATPAARRRRPTVCRRSCTCNVRNPSGGGSPNRSSYLATARLRALSQAVLLTLRSGLPRKVNTAVPCLPRQRSMIERATELSTQVILLVLSSVTRDQEYAAVQLGHCD